MLSFHFHLRASQIEGPLSLWPKLCIWGIAPLWAYKYKDSEQIVGPTTKPHALWFMMALIILMSTTQWTHMQFSAWPNTLLSCDAWRSKWNSVSRKIRWGIRRHLLATPVKVGTKCRGTPLVYNNFKIHMYWVGKHNKGFKLQYFNLEIGAYSCLCLLICYSGSRHSEFIVQHSRLHIPLQWKPNRPQLFELIHGQWITSNEEKVRGNPTKAGDETNQSSKAKCSPLIEESNSTRTQFNQAIGTRGRL